MTGWGSEGGQENVAEQGTVLRMKWVGANPSPEMKGENELPGKVNYFLGNDPKQWRRDVPTYAKVRYEEVYPGIDLVYYGNQRQLEFDYVVAPGASPDAIQLSIQGAEKLEVDAQGELVVRTPGEPVRFRKPVIYQETDGRRQEIAGEYALQGGDQVRFEIAAYDPGKPLVIDPALVYSTYLGGSGEDLGHAIAVDSSGSAYITGETNSTNFPTATPLQGTLGGNANAFVTKLNPSGSALLYSTYLGGNGIDRGFAIAVDASGTAYVAGGTSSGNFPTVSPLQAANGGGAVDAFVARLNASGSALIFSTYLGGTGGEFGNGIALDSSGNAYVAGSTDSGNFPTSPTAFQRALGILDAFVAKLNPTGTTLLYSTYLGGNGLEIGNSIAVDASGNAYLTGITIVSAFPTLNPFQSASGGGTCVTSSGTSFTCGDAFVTKLNADGNALVYSTYLGGSGTDEGLAIAVDSAGYAYVTGFTDATNFPTRSPLQAASGGGIDAFLTKLEPGGSALTYSTYLGGGSTDRGVGVAVDASRNVYVAGRTASSTFPTVNPLQGRGSDFDAFVTKFNPAGSALLFSSYLGGGAFDSAGVPENGGAIIALDSSGNAYVSGYTRSSDFPTGNPLQSAYAGGADAFVVKITEANVAPTLAALSPSSAAGGGAAFTLTVNGANFVAGSVVRWNGNDHSTTFVSGTRLTASILASDLTTVGTAQVTVFNPPPGGGVSNALSFTVTGPTINTGGVVNGASFASGVTTVPGSIATAFGTNLAPSGSGSVAVRMNGVNAPVFAANATQVNFQIPWELANQAQATLTVAAGGVTSSPVTVSLASFAPGIFSTNSTGSGQGAILIANSPFVAAPVGMFSGSRPVKRGEEYISIYCTGLGAVTNQPPTGVQAPGAPPSLTVTTPQVSIGGVPVPVAFSGLAPGYFGLYQVNVQVPATAPTGSAIAVVLSIGGVTSNMVTIAVQP
ncbi:MAG: SBBP repeat-containing protein [Acidobacteria bacterium]|nr:SBBP repeat-containing protein [Acidobacteriota bacterium]